MSCKSNRDAFMHVRLMTRVRNDIQYKFDNGNQQKSDKTSNKLNQELSPSRTSPMGSEVLLSRSST